MLRVVIADDEERICKLIQILADWPRLGMEVAGIATNGPDALTAVIQTNADILITDIRMPGMDGLELIANAKELLPDLEVIIISGYAQFDYARTAIRHGVGEYLLKPINKDTLNATLEKTALRCMDKIRARGGAEGLKAVSKDEISAARETLVMDLADGRYKAKTVRELENSYRFNAKEAVLQVFIIKMDYDDAVFSASSLDVVRNRMAGVFKPVAEKLAADYVFAYPDTRMIGILNYAEREEEVLRDRLRSGLNQLVALKDLFGAIVFSMSLGVIARSADTLAYAFQSAQDAIADRLVEGAERLIEVRASRSGVDTFPLLDQFIKDAVRAMERRDAELGYQAVIVLSEKVMRLPGVHGRDVLQLVKNAAIRFSARADAETPEDLLRVFQDKAERASSARGLFDALGTYIADVIRDTLERERNRETRPIRMAKQYIREHFAEPLSLDEVSEAAGFSAAYFSTFFKKETGEGFNRYLTGVRIDAAKEYLRETRMPIHEIGKRVGYNDNKYFIGMFKSVTGLTPSEFRKLYG
ncbi:MAG: response regulator [Clostridia bacterium]|nr:response regulator [Clostridia bacterium]